MRNEHDLIGEEPIPENLVYGIHTVRALHNFSISEECIGQRPELIRMFIELKRAYAISNRQFNIITSDHYLNIVAACDWLLEHPEEWCIMFPVDVFQGGAGTSTNMNINEVIANLALKEAGLPYGNYSNIHPIDHVNAGQSTNDIYPSALKLAVYDALDEFIHSVDVLIVELENKATQFDHIVKIGRTQLQDAVPMTVGQELRAMKHQLRGAVRQLMRVREELLVLNLGGTAIGTGINAIKGLSDFVVIELRDRLKWNIILDADMIASTSDASVFVSVSGQIKRLAVQLSKIASDFRILSSGPRSGFNEYILPQRQAGSSIMPGKVNPVIPESMNQAAFWYIGMDAVVTAAAEHGQLQLNAFGPIIMHSLLNGIRVLSRSVQHFTEKCIKDLSVNSDNMELNAQNTLSLATALMPVLGYSKATTVVQKAMLENISVLEAVVELGFLQEDIAASILEPIKLVKK